MSGVKVRNWQLNRDMDFPYEASPPDRQFAAVFDINKCIACQTCTLACKTTWTSGRGQETMFWNNVESKPYGFYPVGWDIQLLDMMGMEDWRGKTYKGKTIFEAAPPGEKALGFHPQDEDYAHPNLGEDESLGGIDGGTYMDVPHGVWMFYLQRICNHCTYPACLAACPRKAIYKRKEDGIVLVDQTRCRGYQECIKACPYKKVFFRETTGRTEKCIGCYPKIEKNIQPQCVTTCIGKIRIAGFLNPPDKAREDNPIDYFVHVKKMALPLYPQFGTSPNVYYIPPIHVPTKFTEQMFGPGVDKAIEAYKSARHDKKLQGILVLMGSTEQIIHHFKVSGDVAIGFDEKWNKLAEVPITEPIQLRKYYDKERDVYRHSIS